MRYPAVLEAAISLVLATSLLFVDIRLVLLVATLRDPHPLSFTMLGNDRSIPARGLIWAVGSMLRYLEVCVLVAAAVLGGTVAAIRTRSLRPMSVPAEFSGSVSCYFTSMPP